MRLTSPKKTLAAILFVAIASTTLACRSARTSLRSGSAEGGQSGNTPDENGRIFPENGSLALTFAPGGGVNAGGSQVMRPAPNTRTMLDGLTDVIMQLYPNSLAVDSGWVSATVDGSGQRRVVYYVDQYLGYVDPIEEKLLYCEPYRPIGQPFAISILDCYPIARLSDIGYAAKYSNGNSVWFGGQIYDGAGNSIYSSSTGNWRYPNGTNLYEKTSDRYSWTDGALMMFGTSGNIYHRNGTQAYSESSRILYFDDGYTFNSGSYSYLVNGSVGRSDGRIYYSDNTLMSAVSGASVELRYLGGTLAKNGSRSDSAIYNSNGDEAVARVFDSRTIGGYRQVIGATRVSDFAAIQYDFRGSSFLLRSQFVDNGLGLASPLGLRLTSANTSSMEFRWDSPSSTVVSYQIAITTGTPGTSCGGGISLGDVRTYKFTSLLPGTRYHVLVCSRASNGESSPPAIIAANTADLPPAAPSGLTARTEVPTRARIEWTPGGSDTFGYSYSLVASATPPSECFGASLSKVSALDLTQLASNQVYSIRLCSMSQLGTASQGSVLTFTTLPIASDGFNFGGVLGFVNNTPANNPVTGSATCPSGYSTRAFSGTPGSDLSLTQCYKLPNNDRLVDFGGAYGYVNDVITVNPVTGKSNCPQGFTTTTVSGTSGIDYPLFICTRETQTGIVEPANFGGFFGTVNGGDSLNPATGGQTCPQGFSSFKVLGSGADRPVFLCYRINANAPAFDPTALVLSSTVPTRLLARWESGGGSTTSFRIAWEAGATAPSDCSGVNSFETSTTSAVISNLSPASSYAVRVCAKNALGTLSAGVTVTGSTFGPTTVLPGVDFGGMYGVTQRNPNANPATGSASCPAGYTATQVYGSNGTDYPVVMCHRPRQAGRAPALLFGGAFGAVNGVAVANPFTGQANCPTGYTAQLVNGSDGIDHGLYVCYRAYDSSAPEYGFFGGVIGTVETIRVNNPVTGVQACAADFVEHRILGTSGLDWDLSVCYQANASQPPADATGLSLTSSTVGRLDAKWNPASGFAVAYRAKIVQGAAPPANCDGGTDVGGTSHSFPNLTQGVTYSMRLCARNSYSIESSGVTASAVVLAANLPLEGADFGGFVGFVNGQVVPNPLTGAISCPASFSGAFLLGTPKIDGNIAYCLRNRNSSVLPLVDYGGVIGVVNGIPVPNPVTGGISCPDSFTPLFFRNTPNLDYPAVVCLRLSQPNVPSPALFGGAFGYVNGGAPSPNPLTGNLSCPAGFVTTQISGHPTLDFPAWFCTKNQ